jgi:electron transport complex protein RnfB
VKEVFIQTVAVIREAECIGCTKCILACPFDAILGASKNMHVVINDLCTGCELCVAPCPVDCIDMQETARQLIPEERKAFSLRAKTRAKSRMARLKKENAKKETFKDEQLKKAAITAAILRSKTKKNNSD